MLAIPSWFLVGSAAGEEPFCCWKNEDAVLYIGVASVAFLLWSLNFLHTARSFSTSGQRLTLSLVAAFNLFALLHVAHIPIGYISDTSKLVCSDAGTCLGLRAPQHHPR